VSIISLKYAIARIGYVIHALGNTDLSGLAAEAIKAGSFDEFARDFQFQIKHGIYWHLTDNPDFNIDLSLGPRDMSSLGGGGMSPGNLMITSDLENWDAVYNDEEVTRPFAALIDMSDVPRNAYYQVNRGFGNEFFVSDPGSARVTAVMPIGAALAFDADYDSQLPQNREELKEFYTDVVGEDDV
jgi:hypothetical protein